MSIEVLDQSAIDTAYSQAVARLYDVLLEGLVVDEETFDTLARRFSLGLELARDARDTAIKIIKGEKP